MPHCADLGLSLRQSADPLLDEGHLRLLAALDGVDSLQEAADALHYTPAAVSARLARLERQLGLLVAERSTTGVTLTRAGRRLAAHAERILALHRDALSAARAAPVEGRDLVRVSVFPAGRDHLLVPAARAARSVQPFTLRMRIADTEQAIADVRDGVSDVAIVYDFAARRAETSGLEAKWLLDDQIVTLLPRDHRAVDRRRLSLGHLAGDSFIGAPIESFAGPVFLGCCASVGFEPTLVATAPREPGMADLVGARVGVAQIAVLGIDHRIRDVTVRYTTELPLRRMLLVRKPGDAHAPAVDALCASITEQAGAARERTPVVPL